MLALVSNKKKEKRTKERARDQLIQNKMI